MADDIRTERNCPECGPPMRRDTGPFTINYKGPHPPTQAGIVLHPLIGGRCHWSRYESVEPWIPRTEDAGRKPYPTNGSPPGPQKTRPDPLRG